MSFLTRITWPGVNGLLEILLLAVVFYYILLFFHDTRGAQVLAGLAVLFITLIALTYIFNLDALNWLLQRFSIYLAVALLVIFQPEIRRALAELGRRQMFTTAPVDRTLVDNIVKAATMLSDGKIGALIAIERQLGTGPIQETGVRLDSVVTPELLASIFYPHTPLHDGGVIIRDDRIVSAGCLFPLSQREGLGTELGTRHRAAIGMSEEADALVVVVSEETGAISVAYRGRIRRGLDERHLHRLLSRMLLSRRRARGAASVARRMADAVRNSVSRTRAPAVSNVEDHAL